MNNLLEKSHKRYLSAIVIPKCYLMLLKCNCDHYLPSYISVKRVTLPFTLRKYHIVVCKRCTWVEGEGERERDEEGEHGWVQGWVSASDCLRCSQDLHLLLQSREEV